MITKNPEQTIEYAKSFAKKLKGGEVVGLVGELGSGKTTFVKGLAEGLEIKENITSPTFVLLKEYQAKKILRPKTNLGGLRKKVRTFVHIDAYRVENIDDIKSIGIEEYFERDNVIIVIEWAEKIRKILPKNTLYINFKHKSEKEREITLE